MRDNTEINTNGCVEGFTATAEAEKFSTGSGASRDGGNFLAEEVQDAPPTNRASNKCKACEHLAPFADRLSGLRAVDSAVSLQIPLHKHK